MAVTDQTPVNTYTGNGVTTAFPFSFMVLDEADIRVTVDAVTLALGPDYTVSGVGNPSGGSITTTVPPANLTDVFVYRQTQLERLTDYQDNGDLLADTVNQDYDRLWMAVQEIMAGLYGPLPVPGSAAALAGSLANAADASKGAGMIGYNYANSYPVGTVGDDLTFIQNGVGAIRRRMRTKVAEISVAIQDFGPLYLAGAGDNTPTLVAALTYLSSVGGGVLDCTAMRGTYEFLTAYAIPANIIIKGGGRRVTFWQHLAAVPFSITEVGNHVVFEDIKLNRPLSAGAGDLMLLKSGTQFQQVNRCEFFSRLGSAIVFQPDGGNEFVASNSTLIAGGPVDRTRAAVRLDGVDTNACPRQFFACSSGGSIMLDAGGMNDTFWSGGYSIELLTDDDTSKLMVTNVRFGASGLGTLDIRGINCTYIGCVFAMAVNAYFRDTVFNCITPNWDITEAGTAPLGTGNSITIKTSTYTLNWTSSGTAPSLGNGFYTTSWSREGNLVTVNISLSFGNTTNPGTGNWRFNLPTRVEHDALRPIMVSMGGFTQSSGAGQEYLFGCRVDDVGDFIELFSQNTSGALINLGGATKTWAATTVIRFQCVYRSK